MYIYTSVWLCYINLVMFSFWIFHSCRQTSSCEHIIICYFRLHTSIIFFSLHHFQIAGLSGAVEGVAFTSSSVCLLVEGEVFVLPADSSGGMVRASGEDAASIACWWWGSAQVFAAFAAGLQFQGVGHIAGGSTIQTVDDLVMKIAGSWFWTLFLHI